MKRVLKISAILLSFLFFSGSACFPESIITTLNRVKDSPTKIGQVKVKPDNKPIAGYNDAYKNRPPVVDYNCETGQEGLSKEAGDRGPWLFFVNVNFKPKTNSASVDLDVTRGKGWSNPYTSILEAFEKGVAEARRAEKQKFRGRALPASWVPRKYEIRLAAGTYNEDMNLSLRNAKIYSHGEIIGGFLPDEDPCLDQNKNYDLTDPAEKNKRETIFDGKLIILDSEHIKISGITFKNGQALAGGGRTDGYYTGGKGVGTLGRSINSIGGTARIYGKAKNIIIENCEFNNGQALLLGAGMAVFQDAEVELNNIKIAKSKITGTVSEASQRGGAGLYIGGNAKVIANGFDIEDAKAIDVGASGETFGGCMLIESEKPGTKFTKGIFSGGEAKLAGGCVAIIPAPKKSGAGTIFEFGKITDIAFEEITISDSKTTDLKSVGGGVAILGQKLAAGSRTVSDIKFNKVEINNNTSEKLGAGMIIAFADNINLSGEKINNNTLKGQKAIADASTTPAVKKSRFQGVVGSALYIIASKNTTVTTKEIAGNKTLVHGAVVVHAGVEKFKITSKITGNTATQPQTEIKQYCEGMGMQVEPKSQIPKWMKNITVVDNAGASYNYNIRSISMADKPSDITLESGELSGYKECKLGAGLMVRGSSDIKIKSYKFDNNQAEHQGGAGYFQEVIGIEIEANTIFSNNKATSNDLTQNHGGAGFYAEDSSFTKHELVKYEKNYTEADGAGFLIINPSSAATSFPMSKISSSGNYAVNNGGLGKISGVTTVDIEEGVHDKNGHKIGSENNIAVATQMGGWLFVEQVKNINISGTEIKDSLAKISGGALKANLEDGGIINLKNKTDTDKDGKTFEISALKFTGNKTNGNGGAIDIPGGKITSLNIDIRGSSSASSISDNISHTDSGGAIAAKFKAGGKLDISGIIIFRENKALTNSKQGGAIFVEDGLTTLKLDGGNFTGNESHTSGGAIAIETTNTASKIGIDISAAAAFNSNKISSKRGAALHIKAEANLGAGLGGSYANNTSPLGGAVNFENGINSTTLRLNGATFDGNKYGFKAADGITPDFVGPGGQPWENASLYIKDFDNITDLDFNSSNFMNHHRPGKCGGWRDYSTLNLNTVKFDGVTLSSLSADKGGALCFKEITTSLTISGGRVEENKALKGSGGAILVNNTASKPSLSVIGLSKLLKNEALSDEVLSQGGAIKINFTRNNLFESEIANNKARDEGGAIYVGKVEGDVNFKDKENSVANWYVRVLYHLSGYFQEILDKVKDKKKKKNFIDTNSIGLNKAYTIVGGNQSLKKSGGGIYYAEVTGKIFSNNVIWMNNHSGDKGAALYAGRVGTNLPTGGDAVYLKSSPIYKNISINDGGGFYFNDLNKLSIRMEAIGDTASWEYVSSASDIVDRQFEEHKKSVEKENKKIQEFNDELIAKGVTALLPLKSPKNRTFFEDKLKKTETLIEPFLDSQEVIRGLTPGSGTTSFSRDTWTHDIWQYAVAGVPWDNLNGLLKGETEFRGGFFVHKNKSENGKGSVIFARNVSEIMVKGITFDENEGGASGKLFDFENVVDSSKKFIFLRDSLICTPDVYGAINFPNTKVNFGIPDFINGNYIKSSDIRNCN